MSCFTSCRVSHRTFSSENCSHVSSMFHQCFTTLFKTDMSPKDQYFINVSYRTFSSEMTFGLSHLNHTTGYAAPRTIHIHELFCEMTCSCRRWWIHTSSCKCMYIYEHPRTSHLTHQFVYVYVCVRTLHEQVISHTSSCVCMYVYELHTYTNWCVRWRVRVIVDPPTIIIHYIHVYNVWVMSHVWVMHRDIYNASSYII